jgi:hypothetical protein
VIHSNEKPSPTRLEGKRKALAARQEGQRFSWVVSRPLTSARLPPGGENGGRDTGWAGRASSGNPCFPPTFTRAALSRTGASLPPSGGEAPRRRPRKPPVRSRVSRGFTAPRAGRAGYFEGAGGAARLAGVALGRVRSQRAPGPLRPFRRAGRPSRGACPPPPVPPAAMPAGRLGAWAAGVAGWPGRPHRAGGPTPPAPPALRSRPPAARDALLKNLKFCARLVRRTDAHKPSNFFSGARLRPARVPRCPFAPLECRVAAPLPPDGGELSAVAGSVVRLGFPPAVPRTPRQPPLPFAAQFAGALSGWKPRSPHTLQTFPRGAPFPASTREKFGVAPSGARASPPCFVAPLAHPFGNAPGGGLRGRRGRGRPVAADGTPDPPAPTRRRTPGGCRAESSDGRAGNPDALPRPLKIAPGLFSVAPPLRILRNAPRRGGLRGRPHPSRRRRSASGARGGRARAVAARTGRAPPFANHWQKSPRVADGWQTIVLRFAKPWQISSVFAKGWQIAVFPFAKVWQIRGVFAKAWQTAPGSRGGRFHRPRAPRARIPRRRCRRRRIFARGRPPGGDWRKRRRDRRGGGTAWGPGHVAPLATECPGAPFPAPHAGHVLRLPAAVVFWR